MSSVSDIQELLALSQELWRDDPREVTCNYGQIAWWASHIPHGESETRPWYEDGRLLGWGWVTGGTELEYQVRPTHRALLEEILDWADPDELLVPSHHADAIARLERHGFVHVPSAPWMRLNERSLDDLPEPQLPEGYACAPSGRRTGPRAQQRTALRSSRRAFAMTSTPSCARHPPTAPTSTAS